MVKCYVKEITISIQEEVMSCRVGLLNKMRLCLVLLALMMHLRYNTRSRYQEFKDI